MNADNTRIKGLYAIIDNSVRPSISNIEIAREVLKGGARIIQLRGKGLASKEMLEQARGIKALTGNFGAILIVNDRADIALLSDADGVHLGQDDIPVSAARKILGDNKLIGVSTHNIDQATQAEREGADYIGFGPIYRTTTKADAEEPKGVDALKEVKEKVSIPVVAIGGIGIEGLRDLFGAGADAAAVISAICGAENIEKTVREFMDTIRNLGGPV